MSDTERREVDRQIREAQKKARRELERKAKEASEKTSIMLQEAEPARADHPYLERKQVSPSGIQQAGDVLLIPVVDGAGNIHGLQRIFPDGSKYFLEGTAVAGHFYKIQGEGDRIFITEGYATGASVHEAAGATVICAFNSGNLLSVAKIIREPNPTTTIVVCADNDQWTEGSPIFAVNTTSYIDLPSFAVS